MCFMPQSCALRDGYDGEFYVYFTTKERKEEGAPHAHVWYTVAGAQTRWPWWPRGAGDCPQPPSPLGSLQGTAKQAGRLGRVQRPALPTFPVGARKGSAGGGPGNPAPPAHPAASQVFTGRGEVRSRGRAVPASRTGKQGQLRTRTTAQLRSFLVDAGRARRGGLSARGHALSARFCPFFLILRQREKYRDRSRGPGLATHLPKGLGPLPQSRYFLGYQRSQVNSAVFGKEGGGVQRGRSLGRVTSTDHRLRDMLPVHPEPWPGELLTSSTPCNDPGHQGGCHPSCTKGKLRVGAGACLTEGLTAARR